MYDSKNPRSPYEQLRWYAKESFEYKMLNALLRGTIDPYALAYARLVIDDLQRSVKHFSQENKAKKLYRRTFLSEKEKETIKKG